MAARNPFSKVTLKPSSLSQHTTDFNKILEQVPVPKIESFDLIKPTLESRINPDLKENGSNGNKDETSTVTAPTFVFGEKLTDRVINASTGDKSGDESTAKSDNKEEANGEARSAPLWNALNENDVDTIENNDAHTLIRMNCKLFILEKDKADWIERGYGILKMIDSTDGLNCKIMMWTDKCFRLILNTKLFESMQIDRANKKTIRFNAYDEGTIRIFIIKCGHQNECEELCYKMIERLKTYKNKMSESKSDSTADNISGEVNPQRQQLFQCKCDLVSDWKNEQLSTKTPSLLRLFNMVVLPKANHITQVLLEVVNAENENKISLSSSLKQIRLLRQEDLVEFEVRVTITSSFKVIITEPESCAEFLGYYEKEPKPVAHDESSEGSNNEESDGESNSSSIEKNDSLNENSSYKEDDEALAQNDSHKKRKTDEESFGENKNKKQNTNCDEDGEDEKSSNLKRSTSSSLESSQEIEEKSFKKSKITECENL